LLAGLGLLAAACLAHGLLSHALWLAPARVLYGVGMLLAFSGINRSLSACAAGASAGRLFGLFDACGKWAGALGGIAAGALVHRYGLAMPFFIAAIASAAALGAASLVFLSLKQRQTYVSASDA
jgi:MFS family permease